MQARIQGQVLREKGSRKYAVTPYLLLYLDIYINVLDPHADHTFRAVRIPEQAVAAPNYPPSTTGASACHGTAYDRGADMDSDDASCTQYKAVSVVLVYRGDTSTRR